MPFRPLGPGFAIEEVAVISRRETFRHGEFCPNQKPHLTMSLGTILLIILILALVGALPTWGHSQSWGYAPSGGLGLILLILVILLVLGKI